MNCSTKPFKRNWLNSTPLRLSCHPPVSPAQLALTTILQAYTGASDAEAIEALTMQRRWQLVLDCLECEEPPFCQATLVRFRTALIIQGLDRRLIERTVEQAERTKGFGSRQLRAALDSSPLWGAARVEDIATAKAVKT